MIGLFCLIVIAQATRFEEWTAKYKKSYSPAEFLRRKAIFMNNAKYVEEKNKVLSYTLSVNGPFADMTMEERRKMGTGSIPTYDPEFLVKDDKKKQDTVYGTIDYRDMAGMSFVTPVGDQGSCSSGYVFAAASMMESSMLWKYLRYDSKSYSLSKGQLLVCTKGYDDSNNDGCDGGSVVTLLKYAKNVGVGSEKQFAYTTNDEYTAKCPEMKPIMKVKGYETYEANDNANGILAKLTQYGPVVAHLDAMDLYLYTGGILTGDLCSSTETTQSVLIVGYGSEKGVDYFVCKNSWGSSWGENGYFRIVASGNNCGLTKYVTYLTSVTTV